MRLFAGYGLAGLALTAAFVVGSRGQQAGNDNFTYLTDDDVNISFINVVETSLVAQSAEVAKLASAGDARDMATSLAVIFAAGGGQDQPITIITASRGVEVYRVKAGDTVASIARARGITEQTLRWANNMRRNVQVSAGKDLLLPAEDGVIYAWHADDTVEEVAAKYKGDVQQVIAYNELDSREVPIGEKIFIPNGILPNNERPDYVSPLQSVIAAGRGNTYAWGQCTYYAFARRRQLNLPVENNWGHARTWATQAEKDGYAVGTTPAVGAIMQSGNDNSYSFGHVAIVESVGEESIIVTDMNYNYKRNVISRREIAMSAATAVNASGVPKYRYIY
ncbi:MAG: LysM peptidoglycan-binding domain-containing protein [Candidatus Nomurabacteria bacterium]|jgi:surface antigen|nr:LysM peptidoglycan-binding domain-containing protein [Candidatus Nomurabacteria bacterium]